MTSKTLKINYQINYSSDMFDSLQKVAIVNISPDISAPVLGAMPCVPGAQPSRTKPIMDIQVISYQ